jgi:hypothetical protein
LFTSWALLVFMTLNVHTFNGLYMPQYFFFPFFHMYCRFGLRNKLKWWSSLGE